MHLHGAMHVLTASMHIDGLVYNVDDLATVRKDHQY